ncbi:MAG: GNAT superfamily N-acetyltransferase [Myxococcota bacterium]|jgi:GNAT superfamily N-acetyltransferase
MLQIRDARPEDTSLILHFICALADYERLRHEVVATEANLTETLFGPRPYAEVLIAEWDGQPVGFALFFHTYSTFLAQPGIHLEDLFVETSHRGQGIGHALLARLAAITVERRCGRLEWAVLDWNHDAIRFYTRLGAVPMDEWTTFRLTGDDLLRLVTQQPQLHTAT